MSKLNIGVGDDFPLDESPAGEARDACKISHHRMRHMLRALRHAHHEHRHPEHGSHEQGHRGRHGCRGRGPEAE